MHIHSVYEFLFLITKFREQRMHRFVDLMKPNESTRILDVGGALNNWRYIDVNPRITLLNNDVRMKNIGYPENMVYVHGDALEMKVPEGEYDIVYSNSLIEHLFTWENQQTFAENVRRVGGKLWIQSPAREFFVEPHLITPFIHWFPEQWKRRLIRNSTIWGWITRPTKEQVNGFVDEVRLLEKKEMKMLFPDCELITEKWLGLSKSYIAYRI